MYRQRTRQNVLSTHNAKHPVWKQQLIEIPPPMRRQIGYRVPVRLSLRACKLLAAQIEESQAPDDPLWDLLYETRIAISNAHSSALSVQCYVTIGKKLVSFWACLDTNCETAIHIITAQEYEHQAVSRSYL